MPKCCRVSFADTDGIRHAVEVQADSLFEAGVLALARFRKAKLVVGTATRFDVAVSEPLVIHTIQLARIQDWLNSGGRTPREQAIKARLRELVQD